MHTHGHVFCPRGCVSVESSSIPAQSRGRTPCDPSRAREPNLPLPPPNGARAIMSTMKDSGERTSGEHLDRVRSRRKRVAPDSSNEAALHAFADALRDILRDEHRTAVA